MAPLQNEDLEKSSFISEPEQGPRWGTGGSHEVEHAVHDQQGRDAQQQVGAPQSERHRRAMVFFLSETITQKERTLPPRQFLQSPCGHPRRPSDHREGLQAPCKAPDT